MFPSGSLWSPGSSKPPNPPLRSKDLFSALAFRPSDKPFQRDMLTFSKLVWIGIFEKAKRMKKGHVFIRRTIVLNLKRFNRMLVKWSIYFAMKLSFLELCELKVFDSLKLPAAQADRTDKTTQRDFKISAIVFAPKAFLPFLSHCPLERMARVARPVIILPIPVATDIGTTRAPALRSNWVPIN